MAAFHVAFSEGLTYSLTILRPGPAIGGKIVGLIILKRVDPGR